MFKNKNFIKYIFLTVLLSVCVFISLISNKSMALVNSNNKNQEIDNIICEANTLKTGYYLDEALSLLETCKYHSSDKIINKKQEYENYKNSFVKYEGNVEHIFFHSLIIYPDLAFDNIGHSSEGYNMWFVTVNEFKRILPLLEEKGFILVNSKDLYEINNNKIIKKDLYLPPNKKPLIISQDDVNYYDYMKPDGFAEKLVSKDNQIFTLVKDKNNNYNLTRDGDLVPILDDYVDNHPEFSYKGAKGILAVTGYEGVFGYRLNNEEDIDKAINISNKLKVDGWEIASHSYTHNGKGFFGENPTYNNLSYDFNKWNEVIRPIVGDTNLFISPFGVTLEGNNFDLAKSNGFDIYFCVDRNPNTEKIKDTILMPRFNIDGFTMFKCKEDVNERFFNVNEVIDSSRPVLNKK
ncbi:MAG: hypothetical protein RR894_05325 [Terrisporobacter sp.]